MKGSRTDSSTLALKRNSHKTTHLSTKIESPKMAQNFCLPFKALWISRIVCSKKRLERQYYLSFLSGLPLKEGGVDLGMTSPIENQTTNLVLPFKSTILEAKNCGGRSRCPPPEEFLAKSLRTSGQNWAPGHRAPSQLPCTRRWQTDRARHFARRPLYRSSPPRKAQDGTASPTQVGCRRRGWANAGLRDRCHGVKRQLPLEEAAAGRSKN